VGESSLKVLCTFLLYDHAIGIPTFAYIVHKVNHESINMVCYGTWFWLGRK